MLIATIVTAAGTGLAAVAALISALVALCAERRTRNARGARAEHTSSRANLAGPAAARGAGQSMLNESLTVVIAQGYETVGEVVMLKEVLEGGDRALVISHADEERVARLAEPLRQATLRAGDSLLLEPRSGYVYERIPKGEVGELVLEEVPDIAYADIGGLVSQIEQTRDAIELPYLHTGLFREHQLRPPKGVLRCGPPGCRKTLIAKAVANSLAKQVAARTAKLGTHTEGKSFVLNIKGLELLNKYVGETERQIRLVFQRAREKASEGMPVIVFFDEMDSIFLSRGSGVSSDVENTIVPQLLSQIDEVEGLENVIVIVASNREDDRPGDPGARPPGVKIKIERPDAEATRDIFFSQGIIASLVFIAFAAWIALTGRLGHAGAQAARPR